MEFYQSNPTEGDESDDYEQELMEFEGIYAYRLHRAAKRYKEHEDR
jgi:hypothetical protein